MSKKKNPERPERGIYLRGQIYWLQLRMRNGKRPVPVTLETQDFGEALERAVEIREYPLLSSAGTFDESNKLFIAYKRRMNEWTEGTALGKDYVVPTFAASLPPHKTPATVITADLQAFHDSLVNRRGTKRLADSSIGSMMMVLKSLGLAQIRAVGGGGC